MGCVALSSVSLSSLALPSILICISFEKDIFEERRELYLLGLIMAFDEWAHVSEMHAETAETK